MKEPKSVLLSVLALLVASSFGLVMFGVGAENNVVKNIDNIIEDDSIWAAYVFDVGQGDSIFLDLPDGFQILVDGGEGDEVLQRLGEVMDPWDREIDVVIATHPHADHIGGLIDVLERYDVGTVVMNDLEYDSRTYDAFLEAVENEGAEVIFPVDLDRLVAGVVDVDLLHPIGGVVDWDVEDVNDYSIVLKVDDGVSSMLLTGDAGNPVEYLLVDDGLSDIDILKVGHHGSRYGSSKMFLDALGVDVALISVGVENKYHHPHYSALKRLRDAGAEIWRTDMHGSIEVLFYDDGYEVGSY